MSSNMLDTVRVAAIKYIGRTIDFKGKSLWEIVGNLKNFGVGRVIVRSMFERYPEKSFMRVLKVQALPNDDPRKVRIIVERTFRGRTLPKPVEICSTSYKADYKLVPKAGEAEYCKISATVRETILPRSIDYPPLLKEFIVAETGSENPVMLLKFEPRMNKVARVAKEGETPTVDSSIVLRNPTSPQLYENIKL